MKTEKLINLSLFLVVCFLSLLILNQLTLLVPLLKLFQSCSFLFLSLLLVFVFEPIIELIPVFSRAVRCTLVYFSLLILIALGFVLIIPVLVSELTQIETLLQTFLNQPMLQQAVSQLGKMNLNQGMAVAFESTVGVIKRFSDFSLSYVAAYFISLDLSSILKLLKRHLPFLEHFRNFYATCSNVVFHYIKGLSLDLLFLFLSEVLLLICFRFKHPFIFALLIAFLNLIPYLGAMAGQLIILLVDTINTGTVRFELFALAFMLQQVEANFIQPYIFNKVLDIKPIVTLISIIVFGFLFGFVGFVLAPILAVMLQLAYRSYRFTNQRNRVGTWENMWYNFEEIDEEDK